MLKVFLQKLAQETLQDLFSKQQKQYYFLEKALDSIATNGLQSGNIKKLTGTKNIFRKRVGRWRILFTLEGTICKIWIIAMEKGTRQDYLKWIFTIQKSQHD